MKIKLTAIGQPRPAFAGPAKDRLLSVAAEDQLKVVQMRQERRCSSSEEICSEIGRDIDVRVLIEEIRSLELGQSSVKKLIKRDLVTLNFCVPRVSPNPQTADDFRYTAEYKQVSDNRPCEHNVRMDGFARFTNDRAKYKATMRS